MMLVLKTHDDISNASRLDISPVSNDQPRIEIVAKELTTILKSLRSGPSMPYISNPLVASIGELRKEPLIRVFNIEN